MVTPSKKFWQILKTNMPRGRWLEISDIYRIIEKHINDFTPEDIKQATDYNTEPTWHRNVRNTLQTHKNKCDIQYKGDSSYKMLLDLDNILTPKNILWIKNVKRNKGQGWAYDDVSFDKPFLLHWPTSRKASVFTPKVGEIIVIFQKPNFINGLKNYRVHLTHLVIPISEEIIIDKKAPNHKWTRLVQLLAMPKSINGIPNPGYFNFSIPNSGLTYPIKNLQNSIGLNKKRTQEEIWDLFSESFYFDFDPYIPSNEFPDTDFGEIEGTPKTKEHLQQEFKTRNSSIVKNKKSLAFKRGRGKIICECCKFDFLEKYGNHGIGFIECHHKRHLAKGERLTKLEDLALVCSNCHRMLHRKKDTGDYYTVEELANFIDSRRTNA